MRRSLLLLAACLALTIRQSENSEALQLSRHPGRTIAVLAKYLVHPNRAGPNLSDAYSSAPERIDVCGGDGLRLLRVRGGLGKQTKKKDDKQQVVVQSGLEQESKIKKKRREDKHQHDAKAGEMDQDDTEGKNARKKSKEKGSKAHSNSLPKKDKRTESTGKAQEPGSVSQGKSTAPKEKGLPCDDAKLKVKRQMRALTRSPEWWGDNSTTLNTLEDLNAYIGTKITSKVQVEITSESTEEDLDEVGQVLT
jgi:hypothetical protein